MSEIGLITLMCFAQFALVFFKHINVRVIIKKKIAKSVFMTFLIQSTWLISTAIGVQAVWNGNIIMIIAYLISGMLGAYFNFKIKI
jgi:hypothetical protein